MASDLLEALLKLNLAGSAAILAVLALRRPIRRLAGAQVAYALWALVPLMAAAAFLPARVAPAPGAEAAPAAVPAFAEGGLVASPGGVELELAVLLVWAAGAAVALWRVGWSHADFLRRLGPLRRRPDGAWQAERSRLGPAAVGLLRPRIVAPADFERRFTPREQALVLAHEACHVASGHVQLTSLAVLAACLNWFNPLAHLAVRAFRTDQELACDETVLRRRPDGRRAYAEALVKTQLPAAGPALGCAWPRHPLAARIAQLARPAPSGVRTGLGLAILASLAPAAAVSAWAVQPPRPAPLTAASVAEPARPPLMRTPPAPPAPPAVTAILPAPPATVPAAPPSATPAPEPGIAAPPAPTPPPVPPLALEPPAPPAPDAPPPIAHPRWIETPTDADYPYELHGVRGQALLDCRARADGRLEACQVAAAIPDSRRLRTAALALAGRFRMNPLTADGRSVEGARVQAPLIFATRTRAPVSKPSERQRMAAFHRADGGDGRLDRREYATVLADFGQARQADAGFARRDADGDGFVSVQEFATRLRP